MFVGHIVGTCLGRLNHCYAYEKCGESEDFYLYIF